MDSMVLGRTGLKTGSSGFGALPLQRVSFEVAGKLLLKAYENGINFFDTARAYSDSEEKIGNSLSGVRKNIVIATKTSASDAKGFYEQLETSLRNLRTDYIDIYQLHNPAKMPEPEDSSGLYDALLEVTKRGLVRFIGLSNHRLDIALKASASGLYDTIQFPLSTLSSEEDLKLIEACRKSNTGLIAMKALAGGLITNAASAFAFLRQFGNVLPIWGIQKEAELDEFLSLEKNPPILDAEMMRLIDQDREELTGSFCRACGYCMPCPAGIQINTSARMSLLLRRARYQDFLGEEWHDRMELIEGCINCGQCKKRCPYGLNTPELLKRNLEDYREFYNSHKN